MARRSASNGKNSRMTLVSGPIFAKEWQVHSFSGFFLSRPPLHSSSASTSRPTDFRVGNEVLRFSMFMVDAPWPPPDPDKPPRDRPVTSLNGRNHSAVSTAVSRTWWRNSDGETLQDMGVDEDEPLAIVKARLNRASLVKDRSTIHQGDISSI